VKATLAGIARSLKHRNYRLFFSGQTVSLIGTWLTRVASSWLAYRLSHSALVLGLVSFAGLIPTFLIAPFAGVLADRWNKHRVLILTQVCAALQSAALAVLTISGRMTIPHLIGLSAVQGLINAFDMPVRQSLVVELDPVTIPAMLDALLAARLLDEDAAHGLRRGGEEMAAMFPFLLRVRIHQTDIRFMHKRRRFQCLTRRFPRQLGSRQTPQLLVDHRQQPLGSGLITAPNRVKDLGDVGHDNLVYRRQHG